MLVDKEESVLTKLLKDIQNKPSDWISILNQQAVDKIPNFRELLDLAKQKQIIAEENEVIKASLGSEKIKKFLAEFDDKFCSNAFMRKIVSEYEYGTYANKLNQKAKSSIERIGYNQLDEKEAFIENWYVGYHDWGGRYGNGVATGEDSRVIEEIVNNVARTKIDRSVLESSIENCIAELKNKNFKPNVILVSLDPDDYRYKTGTVEFMPKWSKNCPPVNIGNYEGILKIKEDSLPVFRIFRRKKKENIICILDLKKIGTWTQYNPCDTEKEKDFLHKEFYLEIIDLNRDDELRNKIIVDKPDWLSKYPDQERYLRQKVVIKVLERFEYNLKNKEAGVILEI
jgi:hypothetical protein